MTKKLTLNIVEIENGEIKLEVDANTTANVVHASVINLLPEAIKQFADGLAKENEELYNKMISEAIGVLAGGIVPSAKVDVSVKDLKPVINILEFATQVATKFINKVDTGKARSVETYQDMKTLVEMIKNIATEQETTKQ